MVIITNETNARRVFKKYKNVAAFSLGGKSKGISDEEINITYAKLTGLLPDADDINAVLNGDMKGSKLIKRMVKALHKPDGDNRMFCVTMAQLINIVAPDKSNRPKKGGPNVLVFVTDDNAEDDKIIKAKNKFLTRYVTALFQEFGIEPVTDTKTIKKLFSKGKKSKIVERVAKYMGSHKHCRISSAGLSLKKILFTFYSIELHEAGLSHADIKRLSKNGIKILAKNLVRVYTNDNMQSICSLGLKSKPTDKLNKKLKKSNKAAVEAYDSLREILKVAVPDLKMPKVENGYKKKGKKSMKNGKTKMNVKKFRDFFEKRKNVGILALVYAHTTCLSADVEIGSKEYNSFMKGTLDAFDSEDFIKAFKSAATAYGKTVGAAG